MPRPRSDHLLPRIIRFLDAPHYLGIDRNRFNAEVQPNLTEIPIGKRGIGSMSAETAARGVSVEVGQTNIGAYING
jgi:hypothetical protein